MAALLYPLQRKAYVKGPRAEDDAHSVDGRVKSTRLLSEAVASDEARSAERTMPMRENIDDRARGSQEESRETRRAEHSS